eukprot:Nk52_evm2s311 gene=Nk52_evmTU2s311
MQTKDIPHTDGETNFGHDRDELNTNDGKTDFVTEDGKDLGNSDSETHGQGVEDGTEDQGKNHSEEEDATNADKMEAEEKKKIEQNTVDKKDEHESAEKPVEEKDTKGEETSQDKPDNSGGGAVEKKESTEGSGATDTKPTSEGENSDTQKTGTNDAKPTTEGEKETANDSGTKEPTLKDILYFDELDDDARTAEAKAMSKDTFVEDKDVPHIYYGVVVDAGSSGTRAHLFQFVKKPEDSKPKIAEINKSDYKPGVSKDGGYKWGKSLKEVVKLIPKAKRENTPAVLKATAGLRALPDADVTRILGECRETLKASGLHVSDGTDAVEVMDGLWEAIFAWVSVNMIHQTLGSPVDKTLGMLDLGGGSTQVVVALEKSDVTALAETGKKDIKEFKYEDTTYSLYAHSFMHYGLNSIRKRLLFGDEGAQANASRPFDHTCVVKGSKGKFDNWESTDVAIVGQETLDLGKCEAKIEELIGSNDVKADAPMCSAKHPLLKCSAIPPSIKDKSFVAMSFFYDRGSQYKVALSPASVSGIKDRAEEVCKLDQEQLKETYVNTPESVKVEDLPFACMDLMYQYKLLKHGYGMDLQKEIQVQKEHNNFELTWALGCMMAEMDRYNASKKPAPAPTASASAAGTEEKTDTSTKK